MSTKQWVQHISGTGEKWEIIEESEWEFEVRSTKPRVSVGAHYLPKSEYRLCDPPEVWRDVTEECRVDMYGAIIHEGRTTQEYPYRRRKVPALIEHRTKDVAKQWAFIIEKKVSE